QPPSKDQPSTNQGRRFLPLAPQEGRVGERRPFLSGSETILNQQLHSKVHRFFFEQRARVLASLGQIGYLPPSSTTHRSSSNPLLDALPDPEHASALVLPPQLTSEDTAALRQRLRAET